MQKNCTPALLLLLVLLLNACSTQSDTITVVQEAPRAIATEEEGESDDEEFIQITLGMIDPVTNFDPLFADNLSTKRVLSLIYDGLFKLNRDGEPVPSIAKEVEISDDGLEYMITIDRDIFFHQSDVFTTGLGRRIHAQDIKWVLERTAYAGLPPTAASLLMNIAGFENFYLEQRYVYDSETRVLDGVSGIQVINPETIYIQLNERDDRFLHKLASPYLSIHPSEAFRQGSDGLRNRAIGTGHYILDRIEDDGNIVLTRDNREISSGRVEQPKVNRFDIRYFSSESDLFQAFERDEIDIIPELGPEILLQIFTEEDELTSSHHSSFDFTHHHSSRLTTFHVYENSVESDDWLPSRLSLLTTEDISTPGQLSLLNDRFTYVENSSPKEQYYVAFSENPFARLLLTEIHNLVFRPESSLVFFDIRIPTRRTSIYSNSSDSFHNLYTPIEAGYWLLMETEIVSLYQNHITGIEPAAAPWELYPAEIQVSDR